MASLWKLFVTFLPITGGVNIIYGGVLVKIMSPQDGSTVRGSFNPNLEISLGEGPIADEVRASPRTHSICSAIDSILIGCSSVAEGGHSVEPVTPPTDDGFGHNMHVLEVDVYILMYVSVSFTFGHGLIRKVWLVGARGQPLLTANASVVFSSRSKGALHMPDSTEVS